jgi:hypothetical protein
MWAASLVNFNHVESSRLTVSDVSSVMARTLCKNRAYILSLCMILNSVRQLLSVTQLSRRNGGEIEPSFFELLQQLLKSQFPALYFWLWDDILIWFRSPLVCYCTGIAPSRVKADFIDRLNQWRLSPPKNRSKIWRIPPSFLAWLPPPPKEKFLTLVATCNVACVSENDMIKARIFFIPPEFLFSFPQFFYWRSSRHSLWI